MRATACPCVRGGIRPACAALPWSFEIYGEGGSWRDSNRGPPLRTFGLSLPLGAHGHAVPILYTSAPFPARKYTASITGAENVAPLSRRKSTCSCRGLFGQGPGTSLVAADRLRVSSNGQTDATVLPVEGALVPLSLRWGHQRARSNNLSVPCDVAAYRVVTRPALFGGSPAS